MGYMQLLIHIGEIPEARFTLIEVTAVKA